MHDPFEESLRDMLNSSSSSRDDDAVLGRVLKTANRWAPVICSVFWVVARKR
jgi:hypothetical protein